MPIYEYECIVCGKQHEIMQKHNDTPVTECPGCGGTMRKLISNTSFVLKGTGWYKTDYASPTNVKEGGEGKADTEKQKTGEAEKESAKTENKTEASVKK